MRLVYFSPTSWHSFEQRPHKFVHWYRSRFQGQVIWVDPYPTRLPALCDIQRLPRAVVKGLRASSSLAAMSAPLPGWLRVIYPRALPIEPIPSLSHINRVFWGGALTEIETFLAQGNGQEALAVVGKPSLLAIATLKRLRGAHTIFDAMDNFPAFYRGTSRWAMAQMQRRVVRSVDTVWVTSNSLYEEHSKIHKDVRLVLNGADSFMLQDLLAGDRVERSDSRRVFGYVGTIGDWFDWQWVARLAALRPHDIVRIVGPLFSKTRLSLPPNIQLLPECGHQDALRHMTHFDVGLIPFKRNSLTDGVDPIKYYEYRALGLPVISTEFGQMVYRASDPGVYISRHIEDIGLAIERCLVGGLSKTPDSHRAFIESNSWTSRFDEALRTQ